jgi:hypothetical protein
VGQTQYQNGNGWAQYKLKMDIRLESEVVHWVLNRYIKSKYK